MEATFWYVYRTDGGRPRYRHTSYESALREAQRLVQCIHGEFVVLKAEAIVKPAPKFVVETLGDNSDSMPF